MTEEFIKSIIDAEKEGSEIKRSATEKAEGILAEAEKRARRLQETSVDVCKAYRETQMKLAQEEAEKAYQKKMEESKKLAKEYCANALENAENSVNNIVGRIISGNC